MTNGKKAVEKGTKVKLDFASGEFLTGWLNGRGSTKKIYKCAMKRYAQYTGMTPEQMLEEKQADLKLPPMKQGKAERRVKGFFEWLKTEYLNKKTGKKGMAGKSALTYVGAIADFYSRHNLPLKLKWREDFRAVPKPVNVTEKMTASLVEKLAYYAPELRDKAIIWCQFQGLMDISTVLSLNCGHVADEIADPPMGAVMLKNLVREKELVKHHTFIYKTAIKHLKMYLEERFGEDWLEEIRKPENYDKPLFLGRMGERHDARYVQQMMREVAPRTFIANGRFAKADINPIRPHSLRASANDQMAKAGAVKELRDFLMGHKVAYDSAYFGGEEGLMKTYVTYAQEALEPKGIPPAIESELQKVETLKTMFSEERKRREELEKQLTEVRERLKKYEPLEPLAVAVKGGLPVEMFERMLNRMMNEELRKMEQDEMRGE